MPKNEVRVLNGYRLLYRPEHHRSMTNDNWSGYIYEHVLVAEQFLGRELSDDEIIHHLDGNRSNNRSENLLVLLRCQHSKLHEWINAGAPFLKGDGLHGVNSGKPKLTEPDFCRCCGATLQHKQKAFCSVECSGLSRRKVCRPTASELKSMLKDMSFIQIGNRFGVSDNAVRKWARAYSLIGQS